MSEISGDPGDRWRSQRLLEITSPGSCEGSDEYVMRRDVTPCQAPELFAKNLEFLLCAYAEVVASE
eukprot:869617-Amorphochlora_amoeboformis.AAC.1